MAGEPLFLSNAEEATLVQVLQIVSRNPEALSPGEWYHASEVAQKVGAIDLRRLLLKLSAGTDKGED